MEIQLTKPQSDIFSMDCRFPLFVGGYGCLRGDAKIATEEGFLPIAAIDKPMRVLSWNGILDQFELALTGGAFPKGKGGLYRVITKRGEFVANAFHRVLCESGKYRCVRYLNPGDKLCTYKGVFDLSKIPLNAPRFGKQDIVFMVDYATEARERFKKNKNTSCLWLLGDKIYNFADVRNLEKETIIKIEPISGDEAFYDLQVLNNNNYITEDGTIHHNSGKTFSLIINTLRDAMSFGSSRVASYAPTYDLLKLNLIPRLEEILLESGINYQINRSDHVIKLYNSSEIIMRSMDNPARIIAYEVFSSHVDEIDTIPKNKAEDIWKKIIARNRQKVAFEGKMLENRVSCYTTPDHGFNSFTYSRWGKRENGDYQFVRAATNSNPYLPDDYIQTLYENYPSEMVDAYINGEWCNLTSGIVYRCYDREAHDTREEIKRREPLFIGMDFNVQKMVAAIFVRRNGDEDHCVAELRDVLDTPSMIELIQEKYGDHRIIVYPDATGAARKTVGATKSDLTLLREAGFEVRARKTNPLRRERVAAVNKRFEINKLFVSLKNCPFISECLTQQAWDKNGEPDKSGGFDHANDAFGYPIAYTYPINKPVLKFANITMLR